MCCKLILKKKYEKVRCQEYEAFLKTIRFNDGQDDMVSEHQLVRGQLYVASGCHPGWLCICVDRDPNLNVVFSSYWKGYCIYTVKSVIQFIVKHRLWHDARLTLVWHFKMALRPGILWVPFQTDQDCTKTCFAPLRCGLIICATFKTRVDSNLSWVTIMSKSGQNCA